MNTDLIQQAIALLQRASQPPKPKLRRHGKTVNYRTPRAFQSYLEGMTSCHQSAYPTWRERLIAGPYHPWEYDEFERAIVEQTQARQIVLVYTRETVSICRPPSCLAKPEFTAPPSAPVAASKPSTMPSATAAAGQPSAPSSSRSTRSATARRSATGTAKATASPSSDPAQLQLW